MSDDEEMWSYVEPEVRREYERLKNNWLNAVVDAIKLAPKGPFITASDAASNEHSKEKP